MSQRLTADNGEHGFTLLELLVVLVLMGIILSMAVLSVGDGGRSDNIRQAAKGVVAQLQLLSDEAVLEGEPYGVLIMRDGYRFFRLDEDKWQPIEDDPLFRVRQFPPLVEAELLIDGLPVALPQTVEQNMGSEVKPQLVFYASAERTPFVLELAYREQPFLRQRIEAPLLGNIEWLPVVEAL